MDDENIIGLFFDRSENAIIELSNKYGNICYTLSMNILDDDRDAEECVNESLLTVWNTVPPRHPDNLLTFLSRIVRNIAINRYKHNAVEKRKGNYCLCVEELSECIPSGRTVEDEIETSQLSAYINEFLSRMSKVNRIIFVRRFWFMDDYSVISKALGMREGAIRTRISRAKAELKIFLEERGVTV